MFKQGIEVYFQCRNWVRQVEVLQYLRVQDAHRADFASVQLDLDSPRLEVSWVLFCVIELIKIVLAWLSTHLCHNHVKKSVDYLKVRILISVHGTNFSDVLRTRIRFRILNYTIWYFKDFLWNWVLPVVTEAFQQAWHQWRPYNFEFLRFWIRELYAFCHVRFLLHI